MTQTQAVTTGDPYSWYTTVNGVLSTDTYSLYPFEANSVNYGFSKFGELLGIPNGLDQTNQANWVGMEYNGIDPFAPSSIVPMDSWINGWYMDIEYIDPSLSGALKDRHIFAFAMFGDSFGHGGDWVYATTPTGEPHGGRKTNGMVTTEDLKILYNGPRRFIAQSVNHIFDKQGTSTWPICTLTITMDFNKDLKEVILYKDVKINLPKTHLQGLLDVQLSNREEYDLGPTPNVASVAQFFEEQAPTKFSDDWEMAQYLTRDRIEHQTAAGQLVYTLGTGPVVDNYLKVYINGAFVDPAPYGLQKPYTFYVDPITGVGTVTFKEGSQPLADDDVEFKYKYVIKAPVRPEWGDFPSWDYTYDVAQVISSDYKYVAWAAMWPPVSDYTVDGLNWAFQPLIELKEPYIATPKQSPLIIGEWDIAMDHYNVPMFRAVEVKGICDYHDASNTGGAPLSYCLDTEPLNYQLPQVFLPWDLNQAVEKKTQRWVQFHDVTANEYALAQSNQYDLIIDLDHAPVLKADIWEGYGVFSERVLWNGTLQYPERAETTTGYEDTYELYTNLDGTGYVDIAYDSVPSIGTRIEIMYSTYTQWSTSGALPGIMGTQEINQTRIIVSDLSYEDYAWEYQYMYDPLGAEHQFTITDAEAMVTYTSKPNDLANCTLSGSLDAWVYNIKVFKENTATLSVFDMTGDTANSSPLNLTAMQNGITVKFNEFALLWQITPPYYDDNLYTALDLSIDSAHLIVDYTIFAIYNATVDTFNVTITFNAHGDISEHIPGRYEWGIVGRGAASVDSAGLSMVTAALKNKGLEYGMAGADMMDATVANQMPWVMAQIGTGNTWADYYYGGTDYRTALRDHWSTDFWKTYGIEPTPIASSNMIGVGGPLANVLAFYGNDWADAFYGITTPQFTTYAPWANMIVPLSCWNGTKKGYTSTNADGYAVVTTYIDLNGTEQFLIWGLWGRDTYYACNWFHTDGAFEFQQLEPKWVQGYGIDGLLTDLTRPVQVMVPSFMGATSVVLHIGYKSTVEGWKPTSYHVQEVLGTISERSVYDYNLGVYKGGIHDP